MCACFVCLESVPAPTQSGCACRGDAGLAHVACLSRAASAKAGISAWDTCGTCTHPYTGETLMALARAWCAGVAVESDEAHLAAAHMVSVLGRQGHFAEAERMSRALRASVGARHGHESEAARILDMTTAKALLFQGKHAEVERSAREAVERMRLSLGEEHAATMQMCQILAQALSFQEKHAEAERITLAVLEAMGRVYGTTHAHTLECGLCAPWVMWRAGKRAEAEGMQRAMLVLRAGVLGAEHPSSLSMRTGLAAMLAGQGKIDEATQTVRAALAVSRRVLGPDHPETARIMVSARHIEAAGLMGAPALGPGARVVVSGVRARPEHNGKRGTVLFRESSGRYAVAIDGGASALYRAECLEPSASSRVPRAECLERTLKRFYKSRLQKQPEFGGFSHGGLPPPAFVAP